jgi:hypothetical protein
MYAKCLEPYQREASASSHACKGRQLASERRDVQEFQSAEITSAASCAPPHENRFKFRLNTNIRGIAFDLLGEEKAAFDIVQQQ